MKILTKKRFDRLQTEAFNRGWDKGHDTALAFSNNRAICTTNCRVAKCLKARPRRTKRSK